MQTYTNPNDKSEFLTSAETATYLAISKSTFYRLIEKRQLRFYKIGGSLKFRRKDLEQYIESCRIEPIGR